MIKIILKIVKRIIMSIFLLYGLNLLINSLDIIIPINFITISSVSILGIPALLTLVVLYFLI